jgi:hypothetical protein
MKLKIFSVILTFAVLSGCGVGEEDFTTQPVEKGSLLVIDEANQTLNRVSLSDFKTGSVGYVGEAANDIEIDGKYAYVVSSLSAAIFRINLEGGYVTTFTYNQYPKPNPYNIAVDEGNIYATLSVGNRLSVISKDTFKEIEAIDLVDNGYPEGVTFDENHIYIASSDGYIEWGNPGNYKNGRVVVIDKNDYSIVTNIPVFDNAQSVSYGDNGFVYVACTGEYDTGNFSYTGGGLVAINTSDFSTNVIQKDYQFYVVKYNDNRIYAIDSAYGHTKQGLVIYSTDGTKITNLLEGKNLKGLDFNNEKIYVSHGYSVDIANSYIIDKESFDITVISNTGGGDLALYK